MQLTNSGQESGHGGVLLVTNDLIFAKETIAGTLHGSELGIALTFKLSQAEGELVELCLDIVEQLLGGRSLRNTVLVGETVQGCSVLELLHLTAAQADTDLDTPHLANFGSAIAFATLAWCKDNLLLVLDLVAAKEPRSCALNQVTVVTLGDLFQQR